MSAARASSEDSGPSAIPNSSTFRRLPAFASNLRRHEKNAAASSVPGTATTSEAHDTAQPRSTTFSSLSRMLAGDSPVMKGKRVIADKDSDVVANPSRTTLQAPSSPTSPSIASSALFGYTIQPSASTSFTRQQNALPSPRVTIPSFSAMSDSREPITYNPRPIEEDTISPESSRPKRIQPVEPQNKAFAGSLEPPIYLHSPAPAVQQGKLLVPPADAPGAGGPPTGVPKRKESILSPDALGAAFNQPIGKGEESLDSPIISSGHQRISDHRQTGAASMKKSSSVDTGPQSTLERIPSTSVEQLAAEDAGPSRPPRSSNRNDKAVYRLESASSRARPTLTANARVPRAPASSMYFATLPSYGDPPSKPLRAHTGTLVGDKFWIIGGVDGKRCWREVAFLDTETMEWRSITTTGDQLPPLRAHTATAVGDNLYIFGGGDGPTYSNEVWVFDTTTYRFSRPKLHSPRNHLPPPRRAHTTVLYLHYLVVFGGGNGQAALNDVWALNIADPDKLTWHEWGTNGQIPQKKGYHTANLVGDKMVVFGGSDGHASFADVHVLNLKTLVWTLVNTDVKHNRLSHTSTQVGSYLFVLGGHSGQSYAQDILLFNLVTLQWELKTSRGRSPPGRGYHVALLHDARILIFGGYNGTTVFDDLWGLELGASAYLPQVTTFEVEETSIGPVDELAE